MVSLRKNWIKVVWVAMAVITISIVLFAFAGQNKANKGASQNAAFNVITEACNSSGFFVVIQNKGSELILQSANISDLANVSNVFDKTMVFIPATVIGTENSTVIFKSINPDIAVCGSPMKAYSMIFCISYDAPLVNSTTTFYSCGKLGFKPDNATA